MNSYSDFTCYELVFGIQANSFRGNKKKVFEVYVMNTMSVKPDFFWKIPKLKVN